MASNRLGTSSRAKVRSIFIPWFNFNFTVKMLFLLFYCVCVAEVLTKENIVEPMREIRRALLEADVS